MSAKKEHSAREKKLEAKAKKLRAKLGRAEAKAARGKKRARLSDASAASAQAPRCRTGGAWATTRPASPPPRC